MTQDFVYQLVRLEAKTLSGQIEKAIATFQVYINPAVGWHLASFFARTRMMFPITVIGRDHWLFKAYMMQLNPNLCHDSYVESAFEIFHNPGMAAKLKALLITGLDDPIDAHLTIVAEKTGIPRHTVEAFEILFTNVLDRPKDGLNISSILYRSEKYFGEGQTPPGGGRK